MKDIAIYGFGGFGREVACLIYHINRKEPTWNIIGFFDDGVEVGTECKYGKVLGNIDTLNQWMSPLAVVIAIGSSAIIEKLAEAVTNPMVEFPNLIAPNVFFFDEANVKLGKGNIITFGCRISCNVELGNFNVLNGCVSLGHDVTIGSYNVMFPDVRVSGQTVIGDKCFFGARTFVAQGLKIKDDSRLGAGAVVLRNPKPGFLYLGNPAKKIEI